MSFFLFYYKTVLYLYIADKIIEYCAKLIEYILKLYFIISEIYFCDCHSIIYKILIVIVEFHQTKKKNCNLFFQLSN